MPPAKNDAAALLARVAERTTDWHFHSWYWGDAIAVDGLLEAHALNAGAYRDGVIETVHRWLHATPPGFDDVLAPGAAIVRLAMEGAVPAAAAERLHDAIAGLPLAHGVMPALEPHRLAFRFGLCIDAVYHLPAAWALYALWRGDEALARRAVQCAVDAMTVLECPTGWAQWYDPTRRANNKVAWSRGLGWAVLGLLDLVEVLEGRGTGEVAALAARVLERLAATQRADGHWAAVLDHPPAEPETSSAAFYVAAALHPAAHGLVALPAEVLERATQAFMASLAEDGTFLGVTADVLPSWDIRTYERCPTEPSPWGQGAALRALAAIVRSRGAGAP